MAGSVSIMANRRDADALVIEFSQLKFEPCFIFLPVIEVDNVSLPQTLSQLILTLSESYSGIPAGKPSLR